MFWRALLDALAASQSVQMFASRYGLPAGGGFAGRFVAGTTVADAVAVARRIESTGIAQRLDYLGAVVSTLAEADAATRGVVRVIQEVAAAGVGRQLSLRLTQVGLKVDRATCVDNLRRILDPAGAVGLLVWIEMESSSYTEVTHLIFETLWQQGYRNAGLEVQARLRRTFADVQRLNGLGARVRLVRGAYPESKRIAYRSNAQIERAFITIMELLLTGGTNPAIATDDPRLLRTTGQFAGTHSIPPERYELQMSYGVRPDLQAALHASGYRVRVSIPFGQEWFRYVMHRIGERPLDSRFLIQSVLSRPRQPLM